MNLRLRGRFSRRELLSAAKVALVATALIALSYGVLVVLLDFAVAFHLTGQVDRQLAARLQVAESAPAQAFSSSGVQIRGRYGLGIYGEPIALWAFSPRGQLLRTAADDPVLPASLRPPARARSQTLNYGVEGDTYRLYWLRTRGGFLLAGESLTELGHVEAVLVASELIAFPFLLIVFFLVALAIGLRSARPVELARRRQLEFTADASHELRTPLSVIEAEVSLARRRPRGEAEYQQVLDQVAREAHRLREIVEDLLWLARLDSEPARPPPEPVDLSCLVRETAGRFSSLAAGRRQQIEVAAASEGLFVTAPAGWIDKLAGTLVDNACRHGRQGGLVRLSSLQLNSPRRLCLRVEDDGAGIAEADQLAVRQRFRRASATSEGHGLGLAIADSVARETGGQLRIGRSSLGGALVEVTWPAGRG
jgi:signal transduction histidine kinase